MRRWIIRVWLVVGLALFGYVLTRQPLGSIGEACAAMGPLVLASPLVALAWSMTRTSALDLVVGGAAPWRELLGQRLVGDGYNAILPMAGIGGEPFKLRKLGEWLSVDAAFAALFRDRMIDNGIGFTFSAACIAIALPSFAIPAAARDALWLYVAVASLIGAVMLALMITRLPGRFGALAGRWLSGHSREPAPLSAATLRRAIVWSLATRALQACETTLLLACIGVPFDPRTILLVDGALNAAGFLGFMFPQGLGVVEGTAVYLLGMLGVTPAAATAFALTRRGRVIVVSLLGVALHVGAHGKTWLRARVPDRVLAAIRDGE